ncbi:MAG: ATP-binding cassette domain-containing protein, partial [Eubacteriales bacterium]|nr:ATP-binding cassette domain-containing protein [Eubacteriales bacterium]
MILLGDGISKKYMRKRKTSNFFYALEPTSLELRSGVTMVSGRSGSGKSTLLNILSGILVPSEGKVLVDGTDLYSLSEEKLAKFRCENMGIIPQGRALIDSLTVMENIMLPGAFYGSSEQKKDAQIK